MQIAYLLLAAVGGGALGQLVSALAGRKQAGANAAHVITQAAAVLVKDYVAKVVELEAKVDHAHEHATTAISEAFLARQNHDVCQARLAEAEDRIAELERTRAA